MCGKFTKHMHKYRVAYLFLVFVILIVALLGVVMVYAQHIKENEEYIKSLEMYVVSKNNSEIKLLQDIEGAEGERESLYKMVQAYKSRIEKYNDQLESNQLTMDALEEVIEDLQAEIEELHQDAFVMMEQIANNVSYPDPNYFVATACWNRMKSWGLNDYVCAGIMGNLMMEVGGNTFDLSWWKKYTYKSTYGICQWKGPRKERLLKDFGETLSDQLDFLYVELYEVIKPNNSFYTMTNEREAALYFAQKFERCGSGSYAKRQDNATRALKMFANLEG